MRHNPDSELSRVADSYFSLLARSFPIMCASDEFHFLPRVQEASQYLDRTDDLRQDAIVAVLESVRDLQAQLEREPAAPHFEDEIDRQLLVHNMAGLLIEMEEVQSWRHNPLLYLKVGCIGVDHALNKPTDTHEERCHCVAERLTGLSGLLEQADDNLDSIPDPHYRAALEMSTDCQRYLDEVRRKLDKKRQDKQLELACQDARTALAAFTERLRRVEPVPTTTAKGTSVEDLLRRHFGCARPLEEVFGIAQAEWEHNQAKMESLRRAVDPKREWQQLYEDYQPAAGQGLDLFQLYGSEIASLREFCQRLNLLDDYSDQQVLLAETPTYLHAVRSGASYSSPLGVDSREQAYFYITSGGLQGDSQLDILRRQRLRREHRFLSAHETYPGHHLLDSIRRHLDNPVRRQVESPLFYEGWAYYAESILTDNGYVEEKLEFLVDCKRRLWRAARCLIDAGLALQRFTTEEAADLLVSGGFARDEAMAQVERFRLNPGYQLCYSLGKFEILELRQRFLPKLGWQFFHRQLLEGGELPFWLASWRFANLIEKGLSESPTQSRVQADRMEGTQPVAINRND